jgi:hypothetical protein
MTTQTLRRADHAGATHDMSDTMQAVVVAAPPTTGWSRYPSRPRTRRTLVQVGAVGIPQPLDLKCYHDALKSVATASGPPHDTAT